MALQMLTPKTSVAANEAVQAEGAKEAVQAVEQFCTLLHQKWTT